MVERTVVMLPYIVVSLSCTAEILLGNVQQLFKITSSLFSISPHRPHKIFV